MHQRAGSRGDDPYAGLAGRAPGGDGNGTAPGIDVVKRELVQARRQADRAALADVALRAVPPAVVHHHLVVHQQERAPAAGAAERILAGPGTDKVPDEQVGDAVALAERIVPEEDPVAKAAPDERPGALERLSGLGEVGCAARLVPTRLQQYAAPNLELRAARRRLGVAEVNVILLRPAGLGEGDPRLVAGPHHQHAADHRAPRRGGDPNVASVALAQAGSGEHHADNVAAGQACGLQVADPDLAPIPPRAVPPGVRTPRGNGPHGKQQWNPDPQCGIEAFHRGLHSMLSGRPCQFP